MSQCRSHVVLSFFPLCTAILMLATNAPLWAADQDIVFGPKQFVRTTGKPNTFTETFTGTSTGQYQLLVDNGTPAGQSRISSATIRLNGQVIFAPNAFNQNVNHLERAVALQTNNTLQVELASKPNSFLTIKVVCVSECSLFKIELTSPTPNSTLDVLSTMVRGRVVTSNCPEVGVRMNEVLAFTDGLNFVGGPIPLEIGQNTITATATNNCGTTTTETMVVHVIHQESTQNIRLRISPQSALVNEPVEFRILLELTAPLQSVGWDFDGDGSIGQEGSDLDQVTHAYSQPGLYVPQVIVTDVQGNKVIEQAIVTIASKIDLEALFQAKWDAMMDALRLQDIEGALSFFTEDVRKIYREVLLANQNEWPALLPTINVQFQLQSLVGPYANLVGSEPVVINGEDHQLEVQYILDRDGLWRILSTS